MNCKGPKLKNKTTRAELENKSENSENSKRRSNEEESNHTENGECKQPNVPEDKWRRNRWGWTLGSPHLDESKRGKRKWGVETDAARITARKRSSADKNTNIIADPQVRDNTKTVCPWRENFSGPKMSSLDSNGEKAGGAERSDKRFGTHTTASKKDGRYRSQQEQIERQQKPSDRGRQITRVTCSFPFSLYTSTFCLLLLH